MGKAINLAHRLIMFQCIPLNTWLCLHEVATVQKLKGTKNKLTNNKQKKLKIVLCRLSRKKTVMISFNASLVVTSGFQFTKVEKVAPIKWVTCQPVVDAERFLAVGLKLSVFEKCM